jgi:tetratricopeptide (TPR) repeat protein
VIFADAQSQYYNGYVRWRTGDLPGALEGLEGYADRANRLVRVDPKNSGWLLERGYANSNLGLFALRQSVDLNQARADFTAAQAAFEAVARQRPTDPDVAFDVTDGYAWLADTQRLAGDSAGARAQRLRQRALLEAMLKRDPRDFHARAGVVSNSLGLARIALAQGRVDEAAGELKSAHALAHDIAQAEPADKDAARQERIIELFQARAWMAMPPRRRPARATILRAVGDCEADAARPHNQELAEFCTILRARAQGAPVPIPTPAPNAPRLSERWLLDFAQEARSARIDPGTTTLTK